MTFSSTPPATNNYEPWHEQIWDKLTPEQQRRLSLQLLAFVISWQGADHAASLFSILRDAWVDPPRSQGFPIDFVPQTSHVQPTHNNRETVTFGSASPYELELQWKARRR